ncbi:MAG: nuclear transport factor 2 family protein [Betaproteobacteria bacterium]
MDRNDRSRWSGIPTQWVAAWNAHDLEAILAHYADDIELYSPAIVKVMGEPSGVLRGKHNVRIYWARALTLFPDLQFELRETLLGVRSITLCYLGVQGRSVAEVMHLGADGKVASAEVHYGL